MALKKPLEGPRPDRLAGMQSQGNRALAMPGAGVPVLGPLGAKVHRVLALPQVVAAVLTEILRRGRRRGQVADRRDHDAGS